MATRPLGNAIPVEMLLCAKGVIYHLPCTQEFGGLHCHHCGYHLTPKPVKCGACGSKSQSAKGLGTERIEDELMELFPQAKSLEWTSTRQGLSTLTLNY